MSASKRLAVASDLLEIASLLRLSGADRFRSAAYERAARSLQSADADLADLATRGALTELPHVGPGTARVIEEILRTGTSPLLERLRRELPPGSAELSHVKSLTRGRLEALHQALGVEGLDSLLAAARAGRVRSVRGYGTKSEERLIAELEALAARAGRTLLRDALRVEEAVLAHLAGMGRIRSSSAGALRRREAVLSRLDFAASGPEPAALLERFERMPLVSRVLERGEVSVLVLFASGAEARLAVGRPTSWGSLLLAETGPEGHVREILRRSSGRDARGGAPDEAAAYASAGLPFFPPEIRGDGSEIARAEAGTLRLDLVEEDAIRGYVHCHTTASDGNASVEEMARAAAARGRAYITITDHSGSARYAGGLTRERLQAQRLEIARAARRVPIRILRGTECDILKDGSLDYPDGVLRRLDVVVASLHERHRLGAEETTARLVKAMSRPIFKIWGHPLGRLLLRRPPVACDLGAVLDALAASSGAVEINGDPHRLDLPPELAGEATRRGIPFVVSTDAHSPDDLDFLTTGVLMARRAGLTAGDVLNTLDADAFAARVRPRQGSRSGA